MKKDHHTDDSVAMTVPNEVRVAMDNLAGTLREGLALAGFQAMEAVLTEQVNELCGSRGRHDSKRVAFRHETEDGSVVLGGRKVPVRRPRVRAADGSRELALPASGRWRWSEYLPSSRRDVTHAASSPLALRWNGSPARSNGLRSHGASSERPRPCSTSRCPRNCPASISWRRQLDGVHFADHVCVVAMGTDVTCVKQPLTLAEGDTENATVTEDLLAWLRERALM